MKQIQTTAFQHDLLTWYQADNRDLPWRKDQDPYKIWVSEIMLQQTRVETVIPYFNRFISLFPTPEALAEAAEEDVLKVWEGLGYYSRARNLQAAVKEVTADYGGKVPDTEKEIRSLRGIGPYTAGAILSIAYGKPVPAVDGNVMRVMSRLLTLYDDIAKPKARIQIENILRDLIPKEDAGDFNQALMELGATVCTPKNPQCLTCPVLSHCHARAEGVESLLPVKAKKKPPRTERWQTAVIVDADGRVLIQKRPETGLLANMWEFPMLASDEHSGKEALIDALTQKFSGIAVDHVTHTQQVRHVFSHIVWEMDVFLVRLKNRVSLSGDELMMPPEELTYYPFSVSHQKIIDGTIAEEVIGQES